MANLNHRFYGRGTRRVFLSRFKIFFTGSLLFLCPVASVMAEGCNFKNYTSARVEIFRDGNIYNVAGDKVLSCTGSCSRGHVIVVPAKFSRGVPGKNVFSTETALWCATGRDGEKRGDTWRTRAVKGCTYSEYLPFQNKTNSWKHTDK